MEIRKVVVGTLDENCYILVHEGKCLVIDPGDQFYTIESQIGENSLIGILITHRHPDHIGALEKLAKTYSAPIYDKRNLKEGRYEIGDFKFEVIYTPGHTEDSITFAFYEYNFMFTGDFIFKNSVGRTDLPTGDMEEMKKSISKIKDYSDRYHIYPGHGDSSTLKDEKENNPFLLRY